MRREMTNQPNRKENITMTQHLTPRDVVAVRSVQPPNPPLITRRMERDPSRWRRRGLYLPGLPDPG